MTAIDEDVQGVLDGQEQTRGAVAEALEGFDRLVQGFGETLEQGLGGKSDTDHRHRHDELTEVEGGQKHLTEEQHGALPENLSPTNKLVAEARVVAVLDFGLDTGTSGAKIPTNLGNVVAVQGLGLFRYDPEATDPVDGETCILPAAEGGQDAPPGRWLLLLPDADLLFSLSRRELRNLEMETSAKYLRASATLTWGSLTSYGGAQELAIPVAGAKVGDAVVVSPPAAGLAAGLAFYGYVSAAGTVSVRCLNLKNTAQTPAAAVWGVTVLAEEG